MGAWTKIKDYTVPSNTTSVVLDDFGTITKDDFVKVVATIGYTAGNDVYLYPNGNTTAGNYYRQRLQGYSTTVNAARATGSMFCYGASTFDPNTTIAYIKLSENNKFNLFSNTTQDNGNDIAVVFWYSTSTVDFASGITSLTFQNESSNGIATGSRIQIYKLTAQKVADITVASNTTQVDITDLNITKDSEYLLVSDVAPAGGTDFVGNLNLMPNDQTTLTGYYTQRIQGSGSSAAAARENTARYLQVDRAGTIGYTHIKLSNIGAFTTQNYTLYAKGTNGLIVANHFVSSTAENITNVTKLNIVATVSNIIIAGSRFQLYKLY